MVTTSELNALQRRAARGIRAYLADETDARVAHIKDVAATLMDARLLFTNRDGQPDYLGRSHNYRQFVSATFDEALVPKGRRNAVQSAIRYHLSPLLRERVGDQAEELGIDPESAGERMRRQKARDYLIVTLFAGGSDLEDVDHISTVANLSRRAVSRVAGFPADTPREDAVAITDEFKRLEEAVSAARKRLADSFPVTE